MTQRTFRDAYGVLQQHAETLRDQTEPNIDDLLTIVAESVEAYRICKERIDAVEAALKAALDGVGSTAGANAPARDPSPDPNLPSTTAQTPAGFRRDSGALPPRAQAQEDDDIPF